MAEISERERRYLVQLRIAEALQEIGILEIAFAPLDFMIGSRPISDTWVWMAGFLVAGVLLWMLGMSLEGTYR